MAVPEHPAARQARSKAWQQITAIGPAGAAQWPIRGARAVQTAALMGLGPEPETVAAGPTRPAPGDARPVAPSTPRSAGTEADGIVWLNAGGDGTGFHPAPVSPRSIPQSGPCPAACSIGGGRSQGPLLALGRCRGRLSGLPGRSHRPRSGWSG